MLATILVIAAIGQLRPDVALDKEHDTVFARRVQEAKKQADRWSVDEPERIFSRVLTRRLFRDNPAMYERMAALKHQARPIFREAAYRQIREAYDLGEKEFREIIANRDIRHLPHDRERFPNGDGQRIRMADRVHGLDPTRFDPAQVKLPKPYDKIAGRVRPMPKPAPPKVFSEEAEKRGATQP